MKRLQEKFRKNGLPYTLIKRNEFVAMYGIGGTYTDKILHYEVIRIIAVPETEIKGRIIPAHEAIPGNELFGKEGSKCIHNRDRAERYFLELTDNLKMTMEEGLNNHREEKKTVSEG